MSHPRSTPELHAGATAYSGSRPPFHFCGWRGCARLIATHRFCREHTAEDERTKREALRKATRR